MDEPRNRPFDRRNKRPTSRLDRLPNERLDNLSGNPLDDLPGERLDYLPTGPLDDRMDGVLDNPLDEPPSERLDDLPTGPLNDRIDSLPSNPQDDLPRDPLASPPPVDADDAPDEDTFEDEPGDELHALESQARRGDVLALIALEDRYPPDEPYWRQFERLSQQAAANLIHLAAGHDLLRAKALENKVEAMKAELGGPAPSALEELLIDRVVMCWLHTDPF